MNTDNSTNDSILPRGVGEHLLTPGKVGCFIVLFYIFVLLILLGIFPGGDFKNEIPMGITFGMIITAPVLVIVLMVWGFVYARRRASMRYFWVPLLTMLGLLLIWLVITPAYIYTCKDIAMVRQMAQEKEQSLIQNREHQQ
ncbi:MAG: hypothetical protein ACYTF1_18505 [Planctomycetota bacterium]